MGHVRRMMVTVCLCAVALHTTISVAVCEPPSNAQIEAARQQAAQARQKLDGLAVDLEEQTEEYAVSQAALDQTREQLNDNEADLDLATQDVSAARRLLNERAVSIYRNGRVSVFSVMLGVSDFQDFVSRVDLMRRIGSQDASVVASVEEAQSRLETAKSGLERRKSEQAVRARDAKDKRERMERTVAEQTAYIATLDAQVTRLVAEERARQEQLARERAAEAARLARERAVARGSGARLREFDPAALGAGHPEVVDEARQYVGKVDYVWGGVTPSGFDCSGLTMYVYRTVGVSLPRTSREQYLVGAYIPPDRLDLLSAGDLVFFGRDGDASRIHHVGIYIGGGEMIHAPQTGEKVSVSSLLGRIATRGDYVGAVRP